MCVVEGAKLHGFVWQILWWLWVGVVDFVVVVGCCGFFLVVGCRCRVWIAGVWCVLLAWCGWGSVEKNKEK